MNHAPPKILSKDYLFDLTELEKLANEYHPKYISADPFPHAVIDDFLPEETLNTVLDEFPGSKQIDWIDFDGDVQKKLGSKTEEQMGPFTRFLMYQLNSATFIKFLEKLTGIEGLIPDPHFWGGGLHQIKSKGFLKVHSDFNFHPVLKVDRRINLLIYLNKDWDESYGGELQFWDRDVSKCEKKIMPLFNRCVLFNTTDFSFHGHPEPLTCPPDRTRKSLALYYYSNGRPEEEISRTSQTMWKLTPEEKKAGKLKRAVGKFVPPIVHDIRLGVKKFFK
jgi:Rps23 Pro-64 3,4-dihydroxylase Tpa1-like proline 4-hydroxylase